MLNFNSFLEYFNLFGNYKFLLSAEIWALGVKSFLIFKIISFARKTNLKNSNVLLTIAIFFSALINLSWITKLFQLLNIFAIPNQLLYLIIRTAWTGNLFFYQFFFMFLESLILQTKKISRFNKILSISTGIISIPMLFIIFSYLTSNVRAPYEFFVMKSLGVYCYILISIQIIYLVLKITKNKIPKILKRQVKIIISAILAPQVFLEFIQIFPFKIPSAITNEFGLIGFSACLTTFLIYYCAKKVAKLRFLNLTEHNELNDISINFLTTFKDILDQLSQATKLEELNYICKNFFANAFSIDQNKIHLVLRNYNNEKILSDNLQSIKKIEKILDSEQIIDNLKKEKLFILDEIEFSHFYNENTEEQQKIDFLNQINAELFIPIFYRENVSAYIMIETNSRKGLFSKIEYDQIIIFTNYLSNAINFLENRNINSLIKNEKDLKEELYFKHQEIQQYKESIRSFLKNNHSNKIDIVIYKNRKFNFINSENEIIPKFINSLQGHPTTKSINNLVKSTLESKSLKSIFSQDLSGEKNIITSFPISENQVILIGYYPDVSDIIKNQVGMIKDPSNWDYLLYLETTSSGKLINKLIPGSSETILNFKIELLKTCLGKKATLLNVPEEDLEAVVEIIHEISLREILETIDIKITENNFDIAIKLFGVNPIFGLSNDEPLLKKLNGSGTLFIKNIHLLSLETQQYLAEFLKYGFFQVYKSSKKIVSDVKIICSTNRNLNNLVQEGKFSKELFDVLKQTTISLPSLLTLPEKEISDLVDEVTKQSIQEETFQNILELNDKEKKKIAEDGVVSLTEFKNKVHKMLIKKSKKINIYQETEFSSESQFNDPTLIRATKLGKHALKDADIMSQLWNKFKNQNKIATFLGVNRSSVNRRCKEFNLE